MQHHEPTQTETTSQNYNALSKDGITERFVAEKARQLLQQQEVDALLETLRAEARNYRRTRAWTLGTGYTFVGFIVLFVFVAITKGFVTGEWKFDDWVIWLSFLGCSGSVAISQKHKETARALENTNDLRVVGPLALTLDTDDKEMRRFADAILTRLLPQLRASDADLLDAEQRRCLHEALKKKNTGLILAILQAFEQVGDENDLPPIQKLANGEGPAALNLRIRDAARGCLVFLEPRIEQERARQTLLRASGPQDLSADVLLRPASAAPETAPQHLLRPSSPISCQEKPREKQNGTADERG